jgi:RNA polymerase sigma-70 factor (ECF subfamily)
MRPNEAMAPAEIVSTRSARRLKRDRFEGLLRAHESRLRRLCHGMLTDRTRVDDVLQEAFIKAFRKLPPSFDSPAHESAWLYKIVYRCCLDELRRARRHRTAPLDEPVDDAMERARSSLSITRALRELTPEARAAVLLVDLVGFDYRTAAAALGVPEGTVASRLSNGRARLHELLGEERRDQ